MSKISYQGANVETTSDSFGGWINKTNQIIYDMGTVVVTVAAVAQPNTTNGGQTTGNAHVEGILSSNTVAVHDGLRGGSVSVPKTLDVISNTHFKDSDEVRFQNVDLVHIFGTSNTVISGDLNLDGTGKQARIDLGGGNTTFVSGEVYSYANVIFDTGHVDITAANTNIQSNTVFTTSYVLVDSTNTVIGSANTQKLIVQSNMDVTGYGHFFEQAQFDANVDFYSQHVVFHNDVQIGSGSDDAVVFHARVNSDIEPEGPGRDLGSMALPWQEIHGVDLHIDDEAKIGGIFSLYGNSARQAVSKSTTTGYQDFKFLLETSTGNQKNPVNLTPTSVVPGTTIAFDLGTTDFEWKGVYARDLFISRDSSISGNTTVDGQGDFGSVNVRDLTDTRVVYVAGNGELVDSEDFLFSTIDRRLDVQNVIVRDELRTEGNVFLGKAANSIVETAGDLTVNRDFHVAGNTTFASNAELAFATGKITHLINYDLAELRGNTFIGNANTDVLEIEASLGSGFAPTANLAFDIGLTDKRFNKIYAGEFVGNLEWNQILSKPDPVITINMSGDVAGSANTTLTDMTNGTIDISTTVQPNSVSLGRDTTGDYVANLAIGHGLDISGNSGETQNVTISHSDSSNVSDTENNNNAGTVIQDFSMNFDRYGHVVSHNVNSVNLDGRYARFAFKSITLENDSNIVADGNSDTLSLIEGSNIRLRSNGDALTITSTDTLDSVIARNNSTGRNVNFTGSVTINDLDTTGDLTVGGNLVVNGTTSFVNTETVTIADNILLLNSNESGSPTQDAGFEVERGTLGNVKFIWDESKNRFSTGGNSLEVGGHVFGNATSADKWYNSRRISLSGDLSGSVLIDGSSNVTLNASVTGINGSKIWTSSNDGGGSGLHADLLDGRHAGDFVEKSGATMSGDLYMGNNDLWRVSRIGFDGNNGNGDYMRYVTQEGLQIFENGDLEATIGPHTAFNRDIKVRGGTVWHSNNDGSGSGLNADRLHGMKPEVDDRDNSIMSRNGSGDTYARLFRSTYQDSGSISNGASVLMRVNDSDNYLRPISSGGFMDWFSANIDRTLNMNNNTLYGVKSINFNGGSGSGEDYIKWDTGDGAQFFENGNFEARIGSDSFISNDLRVNGSVNTGHINFDNNERNTYNTEGDVWFDASVGLYVHMSGKGGSRAIWNSGNVSDGEGVLITTDHEDRPQLHNRATGFNQRWWNKSNLRDRYTNYQNTTGQPIMVNAHGQGGNGIFSGPSPSNLYQVGDGIDTDNDKTTVSFIVPRGHWYRIEFSYLDKCYELR